jgi:hypothetical protein
MSGYKVRILDQISKFSELADSINQNRISVFQISVTNKVSDNTTFLNFLLSK